MFLLKKNSYLSYNWPWCSSSVHCSSVTNRLLVLLSVSQLFSDWLLLISRESELFAQKDHIKQITCHWHHAECLAHKDYLTLV